MKIKKNNKGFTLTEMIVVIAIIGILAGVLIPTITGYIKRANRSNDEQLAASMTDEIERYCIENGLVHENLVGTDVRTILNGKGFDLKPSRDSWTYVYNAEEKVVEIVEFKKKALPGNNANPIDPSNYAEGMYLVGEGDNAYEKAVNALFNYNASVNFASLIADVPTAQKAVLEKFNPEEVMYLNNTQALNSNLYSGATLTNIVYVEGTYYIPNISSYYGNFVELLELEIPEIIASVNEMTREKCSSLFTNLKTIKEDSYQKIQLNENALAIEKDTDGTIKSVDFTFDSLVEDTLAQTIAIDVLGYAEKIIRDVDGNITDREIYLVYELTIMYFNTEGIAAKGSEQILSLVTDSTMQEVVKLNYKYLVYDFE